MGLLDYIEDNWRDSYRPFTRYPKIYGEHFEQGIGLLAEEGQGWSSLYKKPLGLLNISAIPALYEAFRDEPIRNTLVNDLNIDKTKANYATQAIGLGLDIGVPWAVIKKGMTPWISEAVRKNQTSAFDLSRRKFLQGAGAAAGLAATGKGMDLLPAAKQVAKSAPDAFGSMITKMSSDLGTLGAKDGTGIFGGKFKQLHGNLSSALASITNKTVDDIKRTVPAQRGRYGYEPVYSIQGRSAQTAGLHGSDVPRFPLRESPASNDMIKAQFEKDWGTSTQSKMENHAQYRDKQGDPLNLNIESRIQDISRERGVSGYYFNETRQAFDDIGWARSAYNHNPKKFLAAGQEKLSKLKSVRDDLIATRDSGIRESATGREGLSQPRDVDYWIDYYDDLIPQLENFLKELSKQ